MNKKLIYTFAIGSFLLGLSSCNDDNWVPVEQDEGTLNLTALSVDVSEIEKVINISTAGSSRADSEDINVDEFLVQIRNSSGAIVEDWNYATTPEIVTLAPGDYTLEIHSHIVQPADWEKPYFFVSHDFKIVAGAIERIGTLTAKLSNSAVSVRFDEDFLKYCAEDVEVEVIANDEGKLVYNTKETRKGYFRILNGSSTIVLNFRGTVNGYKEDIHIPAKDLEAGQHRIYTFRAKTNTNPVPDETGNVDPSNGIGIDMTVTDEDVDGNITFEEQTTPVRPEDRPGYEEPLEPEDPNDPNNPDNPDDPSEEVATFIPSDGVKLDGSVNNFYDYGDDKKPCSVTIECPGKFANLVVDIDSPYLTEEFMQSVDLSAHFDLAEPGSYAEGLGALKLPYGDAVKGQTSVLFDITGLVPLIGVGVMTGGCTDSDVHKFKITVVDQSGKSQQIELLFAGE